ncbi:MAG: DUF3572 domain-containing protein [Hyphomicrobiales bacterium]
MLKNAHAKSETPSVIALKWLAFMARDGEILERFMGLTGLSPGDIKSQANVEEFHAGLLDYLLQDESQLLAFAASEGLDPAAIMRARSQLPGFSP